MPHNTEYMFILPKPPKLNDWAGEDETITRQENTRTDPQRLTKKIKNDSQKY